jgi:hypothetical protein
VSGVGLHDANEETAVKLAGLPTRVEVDHSQTRTVQEGRVILWGLFILEGSWKNEINIQKH